MFIPMKTYGTCNFLVGVLTHCPPLDLPMIIVNF